jgi:competence protein ComEA
VGDSAQAANRSPVAAPPPTSAEEANAGSPGKSGGDSGLVDPNTADLDALTRLPGIGPALAGRILEDRAANGPYRAAADLLRVKGIGPATLARIRSRLSVP